MTRPTHMTADGSLVFPEGYDPSDLTALPACYWTVHDLADAKAARVVAIKAEAERAILTIASIAQQLNAIRGVGDVDFNAIDAIRAASNAKEMAIAAAETVEAVAAIDPSF